MSKCPARDGESFHKASLHAKGGERNTIKKKFFACYVTFGEQNALMITVSKFLTTSQTFPSYKRQFWFHFLRYEFDPAIKSILER